MADVKTHLRELTVATTVGVLARGKALHSYDLYDSKTLFALAKSVVCNNVQGAANLLTYPTFTGEMKLIVDNGFKLGAKILGSAEFRISSEPKIQWLGNDTQKGDPIDIVIDGYAFSLKEESFILKNMGLYTLLNNLTGSDYPRGLHVFSTFAPKEYDAWFAYTWKELIAYLRSNQAWSRIKGKDVSKAYLSGSNVILKYNQIVSTVPASIATNKDFMSYTLSETREKVFSKWIKQILSDDPQYLQIKRNCSLVAGDQVCKKINSAFCASNVFSFFQIYPFEYYYAKTTAHETTILKVPSQSDFSNVIQFKGCSCDVPASQLNIISTFENVHTGKRLQFRNECRFSHGQFNGTPEAKMYVVKDTPLTELYQPIR